MGSVKKIGNDYFIEFNARGLLYQQKAGSDFRKAQLLLEEIEAKIAQGEMATIVRDVDADIFKATFLENFSKVHTIKTCQRYQLLVKHFYGFLAESYPHLKKLSQITPSVVQSYQEYLRGLKVKPGLINFSMYLLRDVLEYAIKLGYLNDNPTLHIRWFKTKKKKPMCLSHDLGEALLKACPEDIKETVRKVLSLDIPAQDIPDIFNIKHYQKLRMFLNRAASDLGWPARDYVMVLRHTLVNNLLQKGVRLINIYHLLQFNDVIKIMPYFVLVEDPEMRMLSKVLIRFWRGGRVAECGGLENRCPRKGILGSNPSLSVEFSRFF